MLFGGSGGIAWTSMSETGGSLADPEEQQQEDAPGIIISLASGGSGDQADQVDTSVEDKDSAVLAG